jgi:DNA-binding FrmR family transcriptional regulator
LSEVKVLLCPIRDRLVRHGRQSLARFQFGDVPELEKAERSELDPASRWRRITTKDKVRLLSRVRRIREQVEAIERALDADQECSSVLQLMAACCGALNGLMAEVLEGHVRFHVLDPKSGKNSPQAEAAEELIDVVRRYLK